MIRFFLILAFVLGSARAANATICTVPTTLVNGNIVDAAQLNGNFTSLQSCGNAVDNTNIGGNGIFASQIKPTSAAQASFGGTFVYAFPAGLNVNGALLKANAGLTVAGTTTFSAPPTMSGANINANTIPNGALVTTPLTGLTAGTNISITGTTPNLTVSAAGAPIYDNTGATLTNRHYVSGACNQVNTQDCDVALTGAAVFSSNTSYWCGAIFGAANVNEGYTYQVLNMSGAGFRLHNTSGPQVYTRLVPYFCVGS